MRGENRSDGGDFQEFPNVESCMLAGARKVKRAHGKGKKKAIPDERDRIERNPFSEYARRSRERDGEVKF